MADLFNMRAPLLIRLPSGQKQVMAECFPHPRGMLYFELFWHLADPSESVRLVEGPIKGDGPWKVGEAVVHVLGCHGTDHEMASAFEDWRQYLAENAEAYPPRAMILAIARRLGATVESAS
jgi:hypothetical protein